jgi:hypothetical protein
MAQARRWVAGMLLAGGLHASGAGAQAHAEGAARVDLDERTFCESRLHGELWARTELYFGLSRADGPDISEEEFQHFVDTVVTPRFPDGLTLLSGNGQFRGANGVIVEEGTKLLILFYPWSRSRSRAADRIRALYKEGFQQEAVLRVDEQSCVSF